MNIEHAKLSHLKWGNWELTQHVRTDLKNRPWALTRLEPYNVFYLSADELTIIAGLINEAVK